MNVSYNNKGVPKPDKNLPIIKPPRVVDEKPKTSKKQTRNGNLRKEHRDTNQYFS